MREPVLLAGDGHTYERYAIEDWLASSNISPMTGADLDSKSVFPNYNIKSAIEAMTRQDGSR